MGKKTEVNHSRKMFRQRQQLPEVWRTLSGPFVQGDPCFNAVGGGNDGKFLTGRREFGARNRAERVSVVLNGDSTTTNDTNF